MAELLREEEVEDDGSGGQININDPSETEKKINDSSLQCVCLQTKLNRGGKQEISRVRDH